MAAYIAGALPEPEAGVIEAHAGDCGVCRELLSALVRGAEQTVTCTWPAPASSTNSRPVASAAPERALALAGSTIGRYELLEQLGVGGMASFTPRTIPS